uniref:Uncharacterized protein n=1 Tax=Tetranychus urticae TaxID=32264 RepID=T1L1T8_TETUR
MYNIIARVYLFHLPPSIYLPCGTRFFKAYLHSVTKQNLL